jgi:hypothetical protein
MKKKNKKVDFDLEQFKSYLEFKHFLANECKWLEKVIFQMVGRA